MCNLDTPSNWEGGGVGGGSRGLQHPESISGMINPLFFQISSWSRQVSNPRGNKSEKEGLAIATKLVFSADGEFSRVPAIICSQFLWTESCKKVEECWHTGLLGHGFRGQHTQSHSQRLKHVDLHSVKAFLTYRCQGGPEDGAPAVFSVKRRQWEKPNVSDRLGSFAHCVQALKKIVQETVLSV